MGILLSGESSKGYVFEMVVSKASLAILATGFEAYCRERFIEIDDEGVPCDASSVLRNLGSRDEREQLKTGQTPKVIADAVATGKSPAREIAAGINFQSYDACKTAFNAGYGLKFGEDVGVTSQLLERNQRLLAYRHRVVHVAPLLGMLNTDRPDEEPEFSNKAFAERARSTMDEFITALHKATLTSSSRAVATDRRSGLACAILKRWTD